LYEKLCQQLTKHWFSKSYSLLNYGWGVQRLFLQYLRQEGFTNCYVYDSYASEEGFGNPKSLQQGAFDYILLQNVIEYVEDHHVLLSQLNSLLSPGSYLLICTRDAVSIKLNQPDSNHYSNERYVPYLLHIYFRESLELLAFFPGWDFLDFFHRSYSNMYWFGFNTSVWTEYQRLFNNSVNIFYEPIKLWKVLTFYAFIFYSIFGYELSLRTYTFLIFRRRICLPHTHLRQEG
jgi:SAM-dependent methyltransferase